MKIEQFDNITTILGDCMEYMKSLPDKSFDLDIVDPPYGIGEDGSKNHSRGKLTISKDYKAYSSGDTTHGGSFSHASACHNLGYELTIIEKDEDYYNEATKRLKRHKSQGSLFVGSEMY